MNYYARFGKRAFDVVASVVALPVLAVASIVVMPAIWLEDRGSPVYSSQRRGRHGRHFTMYKFRSMMVGSPDIRNADLSTLTSEKDSRVTRVGRIIRKTSVDELPQILNVLRGDMSLVGPRPNMTRMTWDELNEQERKRIAVRPGITGLTQATRRNAATTQEKYDLDTFYVDNVSLRLDLEILVKTVTSVVASRNINAPTSASEG